MASFSSVDDLYRSLIQQCVELSHRNEEIESYIFESLFLDQRYDLVLEGLEKGIHLTSQIRDSILVSGDLKLYQYLVVKKEVVKESAIVFAIKSGNLETVIWLIKDNLKLSSDYFYLAIEYRHLEIAKWFHSEGCLCESKSWLYMIDKPNLNILKWLLEIQCPFDFNICRVCIYKNNLELLQWFRSHGCPWDRDDYLDVARLCGRPQIAQWISNN